MSLRLTQVLEFVFAIGAIIGFGVDSLPGWEKWLCCSLLFGLDTWRCHLVGEISTGPDCRWYGFTFSRDDDDPPIGFYCAMFVQVLLTLGLFLAFLYSL
jgi:hypothetical protein